MSQSESKKNLTGEDVQKLPVLRSWESAVKGQIVRIDHELTPPPKQFSRDEKDGEYKWGRLIYDTYKGTVYLDRQETKSTLDEVILFGRPMERQGPSEPYNPWDTGRTDRLNRIEEAFFQTVKAPTSDALWEVYVFRVGDAWYSDYTGYLNGGAPQTFVTAQEAAAALEKRTRSRWLSPDEKKRIVEEMENALRREDERVMQQRIDAEAREQRRRAENAEIAALEAELADIERTRYLNELRAKVARARENGDV